MNSCPKVENFETEVMCGLFGGFGDNLEYFSSTNFLFLTFGVLEIFVDKPPIIYTLSSVWAVP